MAKIKQEKIARSVNLNKDVFERLQAVTARLGVTDNAYILQAVGEAVCRAETQMRMEQSVTNAMTAQLEPLFAEMAKQVSDESE